MPGCESVRKDDCKAKEKSSQPPPRSTRDSPFVSLPPSSADSPHSRRCRSGPWCRSSLNLPRRRCLLGLLRNSGRKRPCLRLCRRLLLLARRRYPVPWRSRNKPCCCRHKKPPYTTRLHLAGSNRHPCADRGSLHRVAMHPHCPE